MARLTRAEILDALTRMGELAAAEKAQLDLFVVGGAAITLHFGARDATKDVDVVVRAPDTATVRRLAAAVATEMEWPEDWLNDAAKGFVGIPSEGPVLLQANGIVVRMVTLEQMLALKLGAWRDDIDISDSRLLLGACRGRRQRDEVWAGVEPFVPRGREQTAWYAFLDLWEENSGPP